MFHKHRILIGLLVVSLSLTAFSSPLQEAGQGSGVSWWVWVLVVLVPLALLVWWWLCRRPEEAAAPTAEAEAPPTPDDLTRIEGIGPKISRLLQAAGITNFAQLAATDVSRLEQIVREAGITIADPSTWPEQASLAAAGEWDVLEALQDELKGGRRA
jgi:hypothetical protein